MGLHTAMERLFARAFANTPSGDGNSVIMNELSCRLLLQVSFSTNTFVSDGWDERATQWSLAKGGEGWEMKQRSQ